MPLCVLRSLWGLEAEFRRDASALALSLRAEGYDGVEASLGDIGFFAPDRGARFFAALDAVRGLHYVCGLYTSWTDYEGGWQDLSVEKHLENYSAQLAAAAEIRRNHPEKLLRVNVHSGSDSFTHEEAVAFFTGAAALERAHGLTDIVSHETHRGRILNNPFTTRRLLRALPDLHITLDISHWFVVCERDVTLSEDGNDPYALAAEIIPRTRHVHARVGGVQSPQVSSLTAEKSAPFERVWRRVMAAASGGVVTMTSEYGPPPYQSQSGSGSGSGSDASLRNELRELANAQTARLRSMFAAMDAEKS